MIMLLICQHSFNYLLFLIVRLLVLITVDYSTDKPLQSRILHNLYIFMSHIFRGEKRKGCCKNNTQKSPFLLRSAQIILIFAL